MNYKIGDIVKPSKERMSKSWTLVDELNLFGADSETLLEITDINLGLLRFKDTDLALLDTDVELVNDDEHNVAPMSDTPMLVPNTEELTNTERYKTGSGKQLFEVLEDDLLSYIEARGFYKANIIKYTHRYKHKGGIEDLKKVKVYVDQLIKLEEKQND